MNLEAIDVKSPTFIIAIVVVIASIIIAVIARKMKTNIEETDPDRLVLQKIYKAGGGPNWEPKYSENWLKAECPIGSWAGIEGGFANGHEHVLEMVLRGNRNFIGTFPHVFPLTNLVTLDFEHCNLSGVIPPVIGNLIHLTYLNLSYNNFTGGIPDEICNLQYLTFLNLNHNPLGGCIPKTLCYMKKIEYLWLANCQLTGEIPLEIGHLIELRDLVFCENKLEGKIPAEIGVMVKLDRLILSMNELSDRIPSSIGQCKALTLLYLDRNNFHGQLPVEVTELPLLQELWVYRTNITIDGEPVALKGDFLSVRLPGVSVLVEQPLNPSRVLVRKDNDGGDGRMQSM